MNNLLVKKRWMKRVINIPGTNKTISYSGRGLGFEKCTVDGEEFIQRSKYWFVSEFNFDHDDMHFNVQIRVWPWPWFGLRSFKLELNGKTIYSEGAEPYKVTMFTETLNLVLCLALTLTPIAFMSGVL